MSANNYAEIMREERHNPASILYQINQGLNSKMPCIFSVLEGKDDQHLYYSEVRKRSKSLQLQTQKLICNGKQGVLNVYSVFEANNPSDPRVQFFIDKDFDDFLCKPVLKSDNIFTTKYYSLENYLVNEDSLTIVWEDVFLQQAISQNFSFIKEKFRNCFDAFINEIKPFMIWSIACKKSKNAINLNNIDFNNFKKLFSIDDNFLPIVGVDAITDFKRLTGTSSIRFTPAELSAIEQKISKLEAKLYLRGKYEFFFFILFCRKIAEPLEIQEPSVDQVLVFLSPRICLPEELNSFFELNFSKITKYFQ